MKNKTKQTMDMANDSENNVGSIMGKGSQPSWAFDMGGFSIHWASKADELNRMVNIGLDAWRVDCHRLRRYCEQSSGSVPFDHQPSTLFVTFFLASLATENLLKGLFVVEFPESIENGKFRGGIISSHNLIKIAESASINLSDDEKCFCDLAKSAIESFGRYPMAKNVTENPTQITIKESAFIVYKDLFERLRKQIYERPFKNI